MIKSNSTSNTASPQKSPLASVTSPGKIPPPDYGQKEKHVPKPEQKETRGRKSSKDYHSISILVIGTLAEQNKGGMEYRVGAIEQKDFKEGLRLDNGSLNRDVALRCFGNSSVFVDEAMAERAAIRLYNDTFNEFYEQFLVERKRQIGERADDDSVATAKALAEADTNREICSVKILHLSTAWPT